METLYEILGSKDSLNYDPKFLDYLEMNMADLRFQSVSRGDTIDLDANDRLRADRNFNLLCNIARIPFDLHWLTLRVNNYREYSAVRYFDEPLYRVDNNKLEQLKLKFMESQSIT